MIDFVDTSLFVRITFWIAIEKTCTMYFYIDQTGLFCRTCRFCIWESLIFKLEMCVHLFINKIVRQYLGLIFLPFSSIYTDIYLQYDKGAIQSALMSDS